MNRKTATVHLSESALQETVIGMALTLGCRAHHQRPARLSDGTWRTAIQGHVGWPDIVIVGPGGLLIRELKSADGRVTAPQQGWLDALTNAGVDAGVWRPADLRSGRILREIRGVARGTTRSTRPTSGAVQ